RIVFIMRHHQGLKLGEIADALGLAEGTVKRQLHAAVHRLRRALAQAHVAATPHRVVGGRA
ncbi:MAG: RNA polymerase sigma factor, partial [Vicinamibacterales bacterium]